MSYLSGGGVTATPVKETPAIIDLTRLIQIKRYFIRIGLDRGGVPTDYSHFSITILKKLYKENRINAKTLVFTKGMTTWQLLGQVATEQVFEDFLFLIILKKRIWKGVGGKNIKKTGSF